MKPLHIIAGVLLVSILMFYGGCKDTAPSGPTAGLGTLTVTGYVAVGNSLPAGYQSNGWYESSQKYSYPNLIAAQLRACGARVTFVQPLWSDPGTPLSPFSSIPSQYFILSLIGPVIGVDPTKTAGSPENLTYLFPYNNLSVPGAFIYDFLNAKDAGSCWSALGGTPNPLFTTTLRGSGTQFQQLKLLAPSLVTFEFGDNDVLAYATSGGAAPITQLAQFQPLYAQALDSLRTALGAAATILVANIPDVTSFPFTTTIPSQGLVLTQAQADGLNALTQNAFGFVAGPNGFIAYTDTGSAAHPSQIKKLTSSDYVLLTCPQDSLKNAGWGLPNKPIPGIYVLDAGEVGMAKAAVSQYNSWIATVALQFNAVVVDVHGLLATIDASGLTYAGQTLTSEYVIGGTFSLDGVHPTSKGQGLLANEFIKALNTSKGASIPLVDIGTLPGIPAPMAKYSFAGKSVPYFSPQAIKAMRLHIW